MSAFPLQNFKGVLALPPVSVASTTATQIAYVDLAGTGQALAVANTGDINPCEGVLWIFCWGAASNTTPVFSVTESDTYNGSYTAISGAAGTVAATSGKFTAIYLTNRGRKRFQKAVVTTDSTQVCCVFAIMCPNNHTPVTAAQIGSQCLETLIVG
jgi:hypothetical protein